MSMSFLPLPSTFQTLLRKTGLCDLLFFVYLLVFVRQYLWLIPHQEIAWGLSLLIASLLCALQIRSRQEDETAPASSVPFWVGVAIPLLLLYAMRAASPDFGGDTLNYHILNGERALHGWPFIPGDFFPSALPINPAPDMVSGIFRHALGYRMGTIVNLLALIWTAQIVDRLLWPHVRRGWVRSFVVILVLSSEYLLRISTNYMVDALPLPLLLEATVLAIKWKPGRSEKYTLIRTGLLLGMSTAFKLSSIVSVIPIVLVILYQLRSNRSALTFRHFSLALLAFIVPLLPFSLYIYWQTGNPAFPFLNGLFKSPYLAAQSFKDPYFGPQAWWEAALWPIYGFIYPERSAPHTLDFFRISLGFFTAAICLFLKDTIAKRLRGLCFITLCGTILWCFSSGNPRYALHVEITGTIIVVSLISLLAGRARETIPFIRISGATSREKFCALFKMKLSFVLLWGVMCIFCLGILSVKSYSMLYRQNWGNYGQAVQLPFFEDRAGYVAEARNIFSDYEGQKYLSAEEKELFKPVEVWVNSLPVTSGVEVMLRPDVPIIAVCNYYDMLDYLGTQASQERLAETLRHAQGKRLFSLSYPDHIKESLRFLDGAGLSVKQIIYLEVPYYSTRTRLKIVLMEISTRQEKL